jgi:hypothetical protein
LHGVDGAAKKLENSPRIEAVSWSASRLHHHVTEGFRVNAKLRKRLAARRRRIAKRLDKTNLGTETPVFSASNIHYELADRTQVIRRAALA